MEGVAQEIALPEFNATPRFQRMTRRPSWIYPGAKIGDGAPWLFFMFACTVLSLLLLGAWFCKKKGQDVLPFFKTDYRLRDPDGR